MATALLVPLAYLISKLIGVDFQNKDNPLSNLGLLFTINQILYILISIVVLMLGLSCSAIVVAVFMIIVEVIFCCCLIIENNIAERHKAS